LLRANARRPVLYKAPVSPDRRRKRRSSSNSHLHLAVAIALATSSLIAVVIPITRTHANQRTPAQSASAVMNLPSRTGTEAGVTAESVRPPLGSGLFPQPLLSAAARLAAGSPFASPGTQPALVMTRERAVSFTVHEDGYSTTYSSMQTTVGQALASQGVQLQEGDLVSPAANEVLSPGAHVYVSHAVPVNLIIAGEEHNVTTRGRTIGEVLSQTGITLQGEDYVSPSAKSSVRAGMAISVTTVRDQTEVSEEPIEYASIVRYDAEMARGQQAITQWGEDGSYRKEYRVRLINGREVWRALVSENMIPPTDEVVSVGTYVKPAAVAVPAPAPAVDVPAQPGCSRTMHVYATWYTAASAGGSGVTKTGTGVYRGIVAVDPRVIPLGTRMYIPGYGYGIAADTGGDIIGNHIDLGYSADDPKDWRTRWVDICIL
jgi:resuscitation-promoting factor RpfB